MMSWWANEMGRRAAIDGRDCDEMMYWTGDAAMSWLRGYREGVEQMVWDVVRQAQKKPPGEGAA